MDRREPLISRGDAATASFLQILQERSGSGRRNVLDTKPLNSSVGGMRLTNGKRMLQRIPIALLRIVGEIPLANKVLRQESADPGAQQICVRHDVLLPGITIEAFAGFTKKFGRHAQVHLSVSQLDVTEVDRQMMQKSLHIGTL